MEAIHQQEKGVELAEQVSKIAQQFGFEIIDGHLDLKEAPYKDVRHFFDTLIETGHFVFHGTNTEEKFDVLEARQANDAAKESGNKKAVYADAGATIPLASAILNKSYILEKLGGFTTEWGDENGRMLFRFSSNLYALFQGHDPKLFSDGYVYILDKTRFANAEDAGAEWHSEADQAPILTCGVSGNIARDIFTLNQKDGNVFEIGSVEERSST
jgi:hypothetical protein